MPYFIKAKKPTGRARGGQVHSYAGRVWPDNAFSKAQLAAIEADTLLKCQKLTKAEAEAKIKALGLVDDADTAPDTGSDTDTKAGDQ